MDNFDEFWHNKAMSSVRGWMRNWWAPRTSNPYHSSNISDLSLKPVRTIAYKIGTNRKERNGKMEATPTLFQNKCIRGNWVVGEI